MAPSSPSFSPVFRETLETLMSQGHGIDKLIVGHKVADEAFELARLGDNGAPSKEKCGRAGDLLAAVILSGVIGNYGEFSLIRLGEIVYQVLKANSESLSTRIVMAFLFAANKPQESVKTVTEAIESLERNNTITPSSTSSSAPPQLETNTKLFTIRVISRLYGMRGWLNSFNLDDLKKSFVLDPTNLLSLFHICQAQQRLLAGSRRGDVALATETIESLYKFILLSLDSSSMSSSGGDLEFVLSSALAFKPKVDPGFIMALYALLDIMFRKGPRGGITFEQLLEGVERVFNVAEELKNNLIGSTTTGYSLKESEVKMLEISSERALKTLDGLKEMAKKNNR